MRAYHSQMVYGADMVPIMCLCYDTCFPVSIHLILASGNNNEISYKFQFTEVIQAEN